MLWNYKSFFAVVLVTLFFDCPGTAMMGEGGTTDTKEKATPVF